MLDLNEALRQFDLVEANLTKLESVWKKMEQLTPTGIAFFGGSPEGREYRILMRDFQTLVDSLPRIDGWSIRAQLMNLDEIAQLRFDAMDLGEFGAQQAAEETIEEPRRQIDEYRHRMARKRQQLVHDRLEELIVEADSTLMAAVEEAGVVSRSDCTSARTTHLERFERLVGEVDRILGGASRTDAWTRLRRHLSFAQGVDLLDINEYDWPEVKRELRSHLSGREPHRVAVEDIGELVTNRPKGQVSTALNWSAIDGGGFERLMFAIISSADGYENPDWLMHTNAPDRGRDLQVIRVRHDSLGGVTRERVIIQCKHWLSKSVGPRDVAEVVTDIALWEPPPVASLVIASSGRFSADAVRWVEQHNHQGKRPTIEMWPESHVERLLAQRPHLVVDFGLR